METESKPATAQGASIPSFTMALKSALHQDGWNPRECAKSVTAARYAGDSTRPPMVFSKASSRVGAKCTSRRLDGARNPLDRDAAVGLVLERLRLNAAEHRGAALLVSIGMGILPDEILIAAPAMRHERRKIALGTGRKEKPAS